MGWLSSPFAGCARGYGNELSQVLEPAAVREKKFVSLAVALGETNGVGWKRRFISQAFAEQGNGEPGQDEPHDSRCPTQDPRAPAARRPGSRHGMPGHPVGLL